MVVDVLALAHAKFSHVVGLASHSLTSSFRHTVTLAFSLWGLGNLPFLHLRHRVVRLKGSKGKISLAVDSPPFGRFVKLYINIHSYLLDTINGIGTYDKRWGVIIVLFKINFILNKMRK